MTFLAKALWISVCSASARLRGYVAAGARPDPSDPTSREDLASAALDSALDGLGLPELRDLLWGRQDVRELLVHAVLAGARGAVPLTRHQRRKLPRPLRAVPPPRLPPALRLSSRTDLKSSVRHELVGAACTELGLLDRMSPGGYRSFFTR